MVNYYNKYLKYKRKYLEIKKFTGGGKDEKKTGREKRMKATAPYPPSPKKDGAMEKEIYLQPEWGDIEYFKEKGVHHNVKLELKRISVIFKSGIIGTIIAAECLDFTKTYMDNVLSFIKYGTFNYKEREVKGGLPSENDDYAKNSAIRLFLEHALMYKKTEGKTDKKLFRAKAWKIIAENDVCLKYYKMFCEIVDKEYKLVGGQRLNKFIKYMYEFSKCEFEELLENKPQFAYIFMKCLSFGPSDRDFTELAKEEEPREQDEEILESFMDSDLQEFEEEVEEKTFDEFKKEYKNYHDTKYQIEFIKNGFNILAKRLDGELDEYTATILKIDSEPLKELLKKGLSIKNSELNTEAEEIIEFLLKKPAIANLVEENDLKNIASGLSTYLNSQIAQQVINEEKAQTLKNIIVSKLILFYFKKEYTKLLTRLISICMQDLEKEQSLEEIFEENPYEQKIEKVKKVIEKLKTKPYKKLLDNLEKMHEIILTTQCYGGLRSNEKGFYFEKGIGVRGARDSENLIYLDAIVNQEEWDFFTIEQGQEQGMSQDDDFSQRLEDRDPSQFF